MLWNGSRFAVQRHGILGRIAIRVQRELHARALGRRRASVRVLPHLLRVSRDILVVLPGERNDAKASVVLHVGGHEGGFLGLIGLVYPITPILVVNICDRDQGIVQDVGAGNVFLPEIVGGITLIDPVEADLSIVSGSKRVGRRQGNCPGFVDKHVSNLRAIGILVQHEFGARDRIVIF